MKSIWILTGLPQAVARLFAIWVTEFRHPAVFATVAGAFSNGISDRGGNRKPAHLRLEPRLWTSALMSETNRSTSQISSSSASSSAVNAPARLRSRSSCARATVGADGRNSRISPAVGCRARNEITSRRRPEEPDHPRRNPRAIISPRRSRSGSSCRASLSGISMVISAAFSGSNLPRKQYALRRAFPPDHPRAAL